MDGPEFGKHIRDFFRSPAEEQSYGTHSTLYLLRRELLTTAFNIRKLRDESELKLRPVERRVIATAILTCTGIDLLGKFIPSHKSANIEDKFVTFCRRYMGQSASQAASIWSLRNSVTHSFGLHNTREMLTLAVGFGPIVVHHEDITQVTTVFVSSLYWYFIAGITSYRESLESDVSLMRPFLDAYALYGMMFFVERENPALKEIPE